MKWPWQKIMMDHFGSVANLNTRPLSVDKKSIFLEGYDQGYKDGEKAEHNRHQNCPWCHGDCGEPTRQKELEEWIKK
jgi:hypothetical protein